MDREQQMKELGRLKSAFSDAKHPGIDAAFDAAEAVLGDDCDRQSARNLTLAMLKGVMERGFMIIHQDELQLQRRLEKYLCQDQHKL